MKNTNFKIEEMLSIFSFNRKEEKNGYYSQDEILEILNSDISSEYYECSATSFEEAEMEFVALAGSNLKYGNDEKLRQIIKKWLELSTTCFQAKKVFAYAFDSITRQMAIRKVASFYGWTKKQ